MKNVYCLSERAIRVIKSAGLWWEIMSVLGFEDRRTFDKHLRNNFPDGPLMNFNVKTIIKSYAPDMSDKDIYYKLTRKEIEGIVNRKEEMKIQNKKYNNKKHGQTRIIVH